MKASMLGYIGRKQIFVFYTLFASHTLSTGFDFDPNINDDLDFCDNFTQTNLAIELFKKSSPKGSESNYRFQTILSEFDNYYVNGLVEIGMHRLFEAVGENLARMMKGYGLKKVETLIEGTIIFSSIFLSSIEIFREENLAVIILQSEQICCTGYGPSYLHLFQACEESPRCIIFEYSDQNYKWFTKKNIKKSVVLLPTLLQGRLDSYFRDHHLPSWYDRSVDASFFGYMTTRRQVALEEFKKFPNFFNWNVHVQDNHDKRNISETYLNSKVCFTIHSYNEFVPGEYHRLSEMAVSGCRPVMEKFGDSLFLDVYERCGGVIFSTLLDMPTKIDAVLIEEGNDEELHRRAKWWQNRIHWESLLSQLFLEDIVDDSDHKLYMTYSESTQQFCGKDDVLCLP